MDGSSWLFGGCLVSAAIDFASRAFRAHFVLQVNKVKLKEVLEPDFMAELGYVQSVQVSKNKEVKLNTKMNYTQVKCAPPRHISAVTGTIP